MKYLTTFFLLSFIIFGCTSTKKAINNNPLLGSWKFKEIHYIYKDTTYIGKPITYGTVLFTPKRYSLLYNPWTTPRKAFDTLAKPTDQEIKKAFQSIVFNSGQYMYTNSKVTTTADMAKVPGFEGGKQFYNYKINKDTLDLTMFDEIYPNGEKPTWAGKLKIKFLMIRE